MNPAPWPVLGIAAVVAWTAIAILRRLPIAGSLADHPNDRSLHSQPTPRVGGIGMLAGAIPVALLDVTEPTLTIIACALALALVSAMDDARGLPIEVRLPAHAAAAVLVVLALAAPSTGHGSWSWPHAAIAVLAIVWMTNLFNFMDGSDGLAGGMAIIGFGALAIAAANAGANALAWTSGALACACCGFLAHNFPPASVFLGDAGSIPLGFMAGALGLEGALEGAWPWWFAPLVFSPFIVDATVTVLRRLLRGDVIWRAHREHLYQRVVLAGWTRRRLALGAYALMAAIAASALVALGQGETVRCAIIFVWLAILALLAALIPRLFPVPGREAARGAPGGGFER